MKNILCIIPESTDATSHYRSIGPFSHLRKEMDVTFGFSNGINWPVIKMHDAVFMQRPFRKEDLQIATMTKENHRLLWVDYDDDLFNLTTDNPAYKTYNQPQVQTNIQEIIQMADVVTVSTKQLARIYHHLNKNIIVCPNAIDDDLIPSRVVPLHPKKKTVMWRGSQTHERDLMSVSKEIIELSHHHDVQWQFLGYNPWFLTDQLKDHKIDYGRDIPGYFRYIKEEQPGVFICPLVNNTFNRSKSNIAWIEATYAGAPCLAPQMDEWMMAGCLNYINEKDFKKTLEYLITGQIDSEYHINESWSYIEDYLTMKKTNQIRKELLKNLI